MIKNFRVSIVSFLIHINESIFFYPKLTKVYKKLFPNSTLSIAIDVGANKGQTIKFFKKFNSKIFIVGFEPHQTLFSRLINNKTFKNCEFYNLGCSNNNGELLFKENILSESSTFEEVNENSRWLKKKEAVLGLKQTDLIQKTYKVQTIRLADFIQNNLNNKIIDILKIDVEGHEINVLKGLFPLYSQKVLRYIQIENHFDDLYEDFTKEIEVLLNLNGFKKEFIIKHGFGNIVDVIYKNTHL